MAGDIWRVSHAQNKCSELVLLLRPIVITWWLSTILLQHHHSQAASQTGPSPDFSTYNLVKPRVFHGRTKRQISETRENDVQHADVLTVGFMVDGVERILDLRLNTDLIPVEYKQRIQIKGNYITEIPSNLELCHYQGSVRGIPDSWVAVSTCHGLKGVIFDGKSMHHIYPETESLDSHHYLYKHSDLTANHTCGYEGTQHKVIPPQINPRVHRSKRAADEVRGPYNANRQSRYVELVLVIDKKEYIALGQDLKKVHHHCKDIANIINALYTPLNIFIALVGVEVWTESDAITLSPKGDTTLSNFLRYRREMLVKSIPNDNAQLLTRVHFEDGVVGKALKGPICTYEFSGGVSMDHSNVIGLVAATVAHEMGHNFGMEHDSADCKCPDDRCIMASSSGSTGPTHWSSCSLEYLALAFEHGMDYCLRNKPTKLFGSSICGNGFVESGEQCDCGLIENCDNPCCNATTCMLHSNASCATGECCDLKTCKPKNAGTQCRSSDHECDLPEYCTGESEYCPNNVFKIDGESCNVGKAFCYQGSCRTHNDQCKLLWGPTGWSSDSQCYNTNTKGNKFGNCGYNRLQSSYLKCEDENILCGMLHCGHYNERLEFGMESVAILSHSFINNGGSIIACRSAIVDLGLNQVDPGLAPDGSKCATGKMCVNQKCMPIDDLRAGINNGHACPNKCGGNGVCNSLGHCHCNKGFRPPDCIEPGYGGSDDSGPAEDPNGRNGFITALYIIIFGIVPITAFTFLAYWIKKNNIGRPVWKKDAISTLDCGFTIKTIDRSRGSPHHGLSRNIETIDSSLPQDPACASLLPKSDNDERFNNSLFGQFKGFSLTPLPNSRQSTNKKTLEPTKPAPPPPTIPTVVIKTNIKPVLKNNALRSAFMSQPLSSSNDINHVNSTASSVNQNINSRPLISSPVLAATTCTSLELIVSGNIPTRPAPEVPVRPPETLTSSSVSLPLQKLSRPGSIIENDHKNLDKYKQIDKDNNKQTTLNRIASMLRPSGLVRSISQPAKSDKFDNNQKLNKIIDKEILRNLKISNPIPQNKIEVTTTTTIVPVGISKTEENNSEQRKNVVMRAHSMKNHKINDKRPMIHSFGSMRVTNNNKRPISIPASTRPTSPPPPVPPPPPTTTTTTTTDIQIKITDNHKIPGLPGYQIPQVKINKKITDDTYDDCMNLAKDSGLTKIIEESPSNDNIYAVIEETIPAIKLKNKTCEINEYKVPKPVETSAGSDGMGLLSEIVSEISSLNFDSIYSASTLDRKKKAKKAQDNLGSNNSLGIYANTNHYKSPEGIYSNAPSIKFNSAVSETSSGYLLPSAVNIPQLDDKIKVSMSQKISASPKKIVESNSQKSPVKLKQSNNLESLKSKNPNVNDELSKVLGMKPLESSTKQIISSSILSRQNISKKDDKKDPISKPPLNRTKTPPHISKHSIKEESDVVKIPKTSEQIKTVRQGSDTSLKSNKSQNSKDRRDSTGSITKIVPLSTSKNKNNSPDVVSSCSKNSQTSGSPDVLGNSGKLIQKNIKTPVTSKINKNPIMPSKTGSIVTKASTFTERKKSPTTNTNVVKSFSTKDDNKITMTKNDTKLNSINKITGNKTNVATLQQKFELQNKTGTINSIKNNNNNNNTVHKTSIGKTNFNLKK